METQNPADRAINDLTRARLAGQDIAASIDRVVEAANAIANCGLSEKALVILLQELSKEPRAAIRNILAALPRLAEFRTGSKELL